MPVGVEVRGVFLDRSSLDRDDLDFSSLAASGVFWQFFPHTSIGDLHHRIASAHVVVANKVLLDATALAQASELRLICVTATGTNNVDLAAARRMGVSVSNVTAYATPSVVQHVFAMLLSLVTRLDDYRQAVAAGRWARSEQFCLLDYPITEIAGKTLGIVGYGELGRAVATLAMAFGMHVRVAARPGVPITKDRLALDELIPQVDVLSLHCPLTDETRGLIDRRRLALMKPGAILINTARGGIVDEQALADALRAHRLGGAAVDVLTIEPPLQGNPLLEPGIPNLLVTPHIAWASRESRQRLLDQVAENIRCFLAGQPRNVVN